MISPKHVKELLIEERELGAYTIVVCGGETSRFEVAEELKFF
jgi:hypothetical protein